MGNMSYCKFRNTVEALQDCHDSISDTDLSQEENQARTKLVELCKVIAEETKN